MPDGSLGRSSERVSREQAFERMGAVSARRFAEREVSPRRSNSVGGFEEPRAGTGKRIDQKNDVAVFAERSRPERGMQDRFAVRDKSLAWLGWVQDLSTFMREARVRKDIGLTDQMWQNYAHRFPSREQLSLSGHEKDRWDECLTEFFYANPVLQRVYDTLEEKRRHRFSDQTERTELLQRQLGDLKHHLQALDRAAFRGYIPQAEQTIVDLERRLEQEHGIELEMKIRREIAARRGDEVSSHDRSKVVSERRGERLSREYSAEYVRTALQGAKDQLGKAAHRFRESLVANGVSEHEIPVISRQVSGGNFAVLDSLGSVWGRMKETFQTGGLFRGLGSMVGLSKTALRERADVFYAASKEVDKWQTKRQEHVAQDREVLDRASWLN